MYVDGCKYWENRFSNWKICVDMGYLEGECDSCIRFNNCFIQDMKTKEMENKENEDD